MTELATGGKQANTFSGSGASDRSDDLLFRKVIRRLMPVLCVAFLLSHMDRLNIGFAQLQMGTDLGFSDAIYGLGASLFFVTYMAFEVPFGLLLQRIGLRKTLLRIMVGWGLVSAATCLVRTPAEFYFARLVLGVCEAGFVPGVAYYLSTWLPDSRRGNVLGIFFASTMLSGVIGSPIAGWILTRMNGMAGLAGWQWMFIIEGLPSCVVGVFAYFYLDDRVRDARWLSGQECERIERAIKAEDALRTHTHQHFGALLRDPKIYLLAAVFFLTTMMVYGLQFWSPTMIRAFGVKDLLHVGLYAAIPSAAGLVAMLYLPRRSDRHTERRYHFSVPILLSAVALALTTLPGLPIGLAIAALALAYAGSFGVIPVFWSIPPAYLGPRASAGGIALTNTLAVFSGVVAPNVVGLTKHATGSLVPGVLALGVCGAAAGVTMLVAIKRHDT